MNSNSSKKIFTVLVVLLFLANVATIALFWFKKENQPFPQKGGPAKFIINELGFSKSQQEEFLALADEHQLAVRPIREEIKQAKDNFFELLSEPNLSLDTKQTAARAVSIQTEKLDLLTFNHFEKVRALCNEEQKKKFDVIIKKVTQMMGMPHPSGPPHGRPPHDGPEGMPPPPME